MLSLNFKKSFSKNWKKTLSLELMEVKRDCKLYRDLKAKIQEAYSVKALIFTKEMETLKTKIIFTNICKKSMIWL